MVIFNLATSFRSQSLEKTCDKQRSYRGCKLNISVIVVYSRQFMRLETVCRINWTFPHFRPGYTIIFAVQPRSFDTFLQNRFSTFANVEHIQTPCLIQTRACNPVGPLFFLQARLSVRQAEQPFFKSFIPVNDHEIRDVVLYLKVEAILLDSRAKENNQSQERLYTALKKAQNTRGRRCSVNRRVKDSNHAKNR